MPEKKEPKPEKRGTKRTGSKAAMKRPAAAKRSRDGVAEEAEEPDGEVEGEGKKPDGDAEDEDEPDGEEGEEEPADDEEEPDGEEVEEEGKQTDGEEDEPDGEEEKRGTVAMKRPAATKDEDDDEAATKDEDHFNITVDCDGFNIMVARPKAGAGAAAVAKSATGAPPGAPAGTVDLPTGQDAKEEKSEEEPHGKDDDAEEREEENDSPCTPRSPSPEAWERREE